MAGKNWTPPGSNRWPLEGRGQRGGGGKKPRHPSRAFFCPLPLPASLCPRPSNERQLEMRELPSLLGTFLLDHEIDQLLAFEDIGPHDRTRDIMPAAAGCISQHRRRQEPPNLPAYGRVRPAVGCQHVLSIDQATRIVGDDLFLTGNWRPLQLAARERS
jgi:hypothetical protein